MSRNPWLDVVALGINVDIGGTATLALDAIVGHRDYTALHFRSAGRGLDVIDVINRSVVVSAKDDLGAGYVSSSEHIFDGESGLCHFRPAFSREANAVTVTFHGQRTIAVVEVPLRL